jgi:hypothetical protein
MKNARHTVLVVASVGLVLMACLAVIVVLTPTASPVVMLGVVGMILIATLALSLGRDFLLRFNLGKGCGTSGEVDMFRGSNARKRNNDHTKSDVGHGSQQAAKVKAKAKAR